jgi:hypothetical protein
MIGVAGGALTGEFIGEAVKTFTGQVGAIGLAIKAIAKLIWSGILLAMVRGLSGGLFTAGVMAAITSAGTIFVDIFNYFYPGGATSAGQMLGLIRPGVTRTAPTTVTAPTTARKFV